MSSSGRSGENKITYVHMYSLEYHAKSTCLTSHFYSIIGMVRLLPKNRYIFYCVFNEPKLHNSTSKSRHKLYEWHFVPCCGTDDPTWLMD